MQYTLEYGGGLGDVFSQMYCNGSYNVLRDLAPEDRATVIYVALHPFVEELIKFHPKRNQIDVKFPGYWGPADDSIYRAKYNLPAAGSNHFLPHKDRDIQFYPAPEDTTTLSELQDKKYIVIAASAGTPDRAIPEHIINTAITYILDNTDYYIVPVGRSYERAGRTEHTYFQHPRIINTIDKLSIPGTAIAVQNCEGLITSHSALNMLAWNENKPQLLLYPQSVLDHHFKNNNPDDWSYGFDFPNTVRSLFSEFSKKHLNTFFQTINPNHNTAMMISAEIPEPVRDIKLFTTEGRFTPNLDTQLLLHLISTVEGNILEIGCNNGVTTKDLALTFPDRHIYGVDYNGADDTMVNEQKGEKPNNFGVHVQGMKNVTLMNMRSAFIRYPELKNVRCIFIDGDHSYNGVKLDSEKAVDYLKSVGGGLIVWHDYSETHPTWVKVKEYLDNELSLELPITVYKGSWIAAARII